MLTLDDNKDKVRLTQYSSKAGWGCKIGPADLAQVLRHLPPNQEDANLLVGLETSDDAGVYRLNPEQALVQTVDFFTPVVDDPYAFGQIAAANALSDIYAMGAKPLTVLNLVSFPVSKLDMGVLAEILRGGSDKIKEAGALLIGGHSIDDPEPKYGLAVTGLVHPEQVLSNATAKAGDVLVLTKPLGVGIITTGIKRGLIAPEDEAEVVRVMAMLNKGAAEAVLEVGVNALTDVTGFGLLGHLHEMMEASGMAARIDSQAVPALASVWKAIEQKAIPGGTMANRRYLEEHVKFAPEVPEPHRLLLADAVTSGGLLISVAEEKASALIAALKQKGTPAVAMIGQVLEAGAGKEEAGKIEVF